MHIQHHDCVGPYMHYASITNPPMAFMHSSRLLLNFEVKWRMDNGVNRCMLLIWLRLTSGCNHRSNRSASEGGWWPMGLIYLGAIEW